MCYYIAGPFHLVEAKYTSCIKLMSVIGGSKFYILTMPIFSSIRTVCMHVFQSAIIQKCKMWIICWKTDHFVAFDIIYISVYLIKTLQMVLLV